MVKIVLTDLSVKLPPMVIATTTVKIMDSSSPVPRPEGLTSYNEINPSKSRISGKKTNPRKGKTMKKTQIDHAEYQKKTRKMTDDALRFTIKDAREAIQAMPDGHKADYYADEINYCAMELKRRSR